MTRDSVDTFIQEMLEGEDSERFLKAALAEMTSPSIPMLERVIEGYDLTSYVHGLKYNRDDKDVLIEYRVIADLYAPVVISYERFEVLVEGILCLRRKRKW